MRSSGGVTAGDWEERRRFLWLATTEFWERFAMSGVKSLLVLVLADRVLAGDLSHVLGATAIRNASGEAFGPLSSTALASLLYGYANALIYLSIPIGGLVGDLVGRRRVMVMGGGIAMLIGLVLMLGERTFLVGLIPFAVGTGLLKGNLSAQVGLLFHDEARRRRGYAVYLGFLNAGVICGPLVCGALMALAGSSYAIGAAAVAIAIGLICYVTGSTEPVATAKAWSGGTSAPGPVAATLLLLAALIAIYLCYSAYDQLGNMVLIWARSAVDLRLGGWTMPVMWLLSLDGLITLALIAGSQLATGPWARMGISISPVTQIFLGCVCCAAGYLVLAIGSMVAGDVPLPLVWAIAYLVLVDFAIVLVWPSGLSLIAAIAPRRLVGFWMGLFYLHGFFASLWVGFSGVYYGRMAHAQFWLLHAAVAGGGVLMTLCVGLPLMQLVRARQATTTSAWAKPRV